MANKESWEYEQEYKERGRKIADELENLINSCPYGRGGINEIVNRLAHNCHPYLRQELFITLFLGFIQEMADPNCYHDGRDEASAKTCRFIMEKLKEGYDNYEPVIYPRPKQK